MTPQCPSPDNPPGDDDGSQPSYKERARAAEAAVAQVAATLGTATESSRRID
jgi:hypothetical protein